MRLLDDIMEPPLIAAGLAEVEACGSDYGEKTRLAVRIVLTVRPDLAEQEALGLVLRVMAN